MQKKSRYKYTACFMRRLLLVVCLLVAISVDGKRSSKKKKVEASVENIDRCVVLGKAAAAAGGHAEARHARIVAHADCLREKKDHAGLAKVISIMASDSGLKKTQPLAVVHACNQVAELAVGGHIGWQEADRVFNNLHTGWDGNAFSLRSHALICTQLQLMERAMEYFEASVRLQPDDYTHSQAVVTCQVRSQ